MEFLIFWVLCGMIALVLHIVDECRKGNVLTAMQSCKDLIFAALLGPVGLVAMIGVWCEVFIEGYKNDF